MGDSCIDMLDMSAGVDELRNGLRTAAEGRG